MIKTILLLIVLCIGLMLRDHEPLYLLPIFGGLLITWRLSVCPTD